MIAAGEIVYCVNKNDKMATFDNHSFIPIRITQTASIEARQGLVYAVATSGCTHNLEQWLNSIYGDKILPSDRAHSSYGLKYYMACGANKEELLHNLSLSVGTKVYTKDNLDEAKVELKGLIKSQLEDEKNRLANIERSIKRYEEVLKTFDPN